jgi:hypothetical protein
MKRLELKSTWTRAEQLAEVGHSEKEESVGAIPVCVDDVHLPGGPAELSSQAVRVRRRRMESIPDGFALDALRKSVL